MRIRLSLFAFVFFLPHLFGGELDAFLVRGKLVKLAENKATVLVDHRNIIVKKSALMERAPEVGQEVTIRLEEEKSETEPGSR